MMKVKALVTGAGGYIGGHLMTYLDDLGWDVVGVDVKPNKEHPLVQYDIYWERQEMRKLMEEQDIIFHLAALTPKNSKDFLNQWWRYNVGVPYMLMHYLKPHQVMVYASTLGVKRAWDHFYAYSKKASEAITTLFNKPIAIARLANVWGRGGKGVIDTWIRNALEHKEIEIHTKQQRDFIHVLDVCSALQYIAGWMSQPEIIYQSRYRKDPYIFEVGSGNPIEVSTIAIPIREYCKSHSKLTWVDLKPSIAKANILRLKNIGWEPKYPITLCLEDEVEWYK